MGKQKQKSKARLDKYYYMAKEHGFRSRAAFKLIQLNKKFGFLESANVLIDLCAAPGGWCQVAAKQMPISSIKIGVDLDPIKPIPGVTTFQCDITTEQCRHLIRKEIKHFKADVVLNDGAPNVGGQWAKDSYTQTELVLYAVKLATDFLREGGWFITKVFRSSDYNSLIYVMRQLFGKVEATKPLASRSQAAEIFVVCSQYKAPSVIDPKLLDPKYALKQLEDEDEMKSNTVKSIKAMFDKKKHRGGYNNDSLYIEKSFKDFIECSNPYQFLSEVNKIKVKTEDCEKYIKVAKPPEEYKLYFEDLQLLGKKEVQDLIIWRNKIRIKLNVSKKEKKEELHVEEDHKEEKEHDVNEEMDAELKAFAKQRKKKQENEKRKQEKIQLRNKEAFIEQEEHQDNEVDFDEGLFEYIKKNKIDIENLENEKEKEEEEKDPEKEGQYEEFNLSDLDEDDYIDMMNEDIEENKRLYEEEKGKKVDKKKNKKKKQEEEIALVQKEDDSDLDDKDEVNISANEQDLTDEEQGDDSADYESESDENEISLEEEKSEEGEGKEGEEDQDDLADIKIPNPLRKSNKESKEETKKEEQKNEEENLSYDTDEEKEGKKKSKKLLNKKTERTANPIAIANKEKKELEEKGDSSSDEGYDTDEKAEIRAIAKKMLRKKKRLEILNSTYNRYAFEDDGRVPQWFVEEEKKHNVPTKPVTKAEILAEKAYLKKLNDRMPKKVLEAKARKRNKLNKRLEKVKKKAEAIYNQEEINEISKVKQIEKLYKKELARNKEKKKYIISRSFKNNRGKDGRNVRHVDRRLKKDKRAEKAKSKRDKKFKRKRR